MIENETWKGIKDYEGVYRLSSYGRVQNIISGRFITLRKNGNQIRCVLNYGKKSMDFCVSKQLPEYFPNNNYSLINNFEYLNELSKPSLCLAGEQWRDVKGYEGEFSVSNLGRIKSLSRNIPAHTRCGNPTQRVSKDKIMRLGISNCGYQLVIFGNKGFSVHRLVAIAFIDNPDNLPEVNHIDGCKTNNYADNLEWLTSSENSLHAYETGLAGRGAEGSRAKFTWDEVRYIRSSSLTRKELAKMFGVNKATIGRIITRDTYEFDPLNSEDEEQYRII